MPSSALIATALLVPLLSIISLQTAPVHIFENFPILHNLTLPYNSLMEPYNSLMEEYMAPYQNHTVKEDSL